MQHAISLIAACILDITQRNTELFAKVKNDHFTIENNTLPAPRTKEETPGHRKAPVKSIADVIETPSARTILKHIGEPTRPPATSPARAPPAWEEDPNTVDPGYDPLTQPEQEIESDQRIQW